MQRLTPRPSDLSDDRTGVVVGAQELLGLADAVAVAVAVARSYPDLLTISNPRTHLERHWFQECMSRTQMTVIFVTKAAVKTVILVTLAGPDR